MKLTETLFNSFPANMRSKGRACFDAGSVELLSNSPDRIEADIHDFRTLAAALEIDRNPDRTYTFIPFCECETYLTEGKCEHLWAMILASDNSPKKFDGADAYEAVHRGAGKKGASGKEKIEKAGWKDTLKLIAGARDYAHQYGRAPYDSSVNKPTRESQIRFTLSLEDLYHVSGIMLHPEYRVRKKNGGWGKWKNLSINAIEQVLSEPDYSLALKVYGVGNARNQYYYSGSLLPDRSALTLLPEICAANVLFIEDGEERYGPVGWDEHSVPWKPLLELSKGRNGYSLTMQLKCEDETRSISEPLKLTASGWIFWKDRISRYTNTDCSFEWIAAFRKKNTLSIPANDVAEFIKQYSNQPTAPFLSMAPELDYEEVQDKPTPVLEIGEMTKFYGGTFPARVVFNYSGHMIDSSETNSAVFDTSKKTILHRDTEEETRCMALIKEHGLRAASVVYSNTWDYEIKKKVFISTARTLAEQGWTIRAKNSALKHAGNFSVNVSSGIDWFDLKVTCDFDGQSVSMPDLLKALKNNDGWVELDDGSMGILPEEWLSKYGQIATAAEATDDGSLRFKKTQAFLLDAWLAQQDNVSMDTMFKKVHSELESFNSIEPVEPPSSFQGKLRHYQADGLGWLMFLNRMGFGGCLADDMGLGKTVQVLALLEHRRTGDGSLKKSKLPSIAVVPQSVVFNWIREVETFTPGLKVLNFTGPDRVKDSALFKKHHLIITTYGTLLRDIEWLKDQQFDYAILDESQAIKNSATQTAKATRLLHADHRLAMSGTPIENHLGELWSLFEYLNPGLLGASNTFDAKWTRNPEPETRNTIARAVRPFILRRTKSQVAKDLPDRQEETLYCELPKKERETYSQLKDHYRSVLLNKVEQQGVNKSKMVILEALLRLRQAACHPGLLDKKERNSCAKFSALLPQLEELVEEGHKALVFSQFTSYLSLLKPHLKRRKLAFEYLDGKTRKRQECVDRFQNNPDCHLFLISLKAGGLGLNLTSAGYVFLLDPWWNPAVEAQAIDRAHRIGQKNKVFAYRLISKDTVEERILELQAQKRQIADDVISEDNAILRGITREDIEFIFA